MRRNFERVRVKNASSEKEKCSPMEDDDDDRTPVYSYSLEKKKSLGEMVLTWIDIDA